MIRVFKFRANDLNPTAGKQIEFKGKIAETFFEFTTSEAEVEMTYKSLNSSDTHLNDFKFKNHLKLSPKRGDYKIYANDDGSLNMKNFLLEKLNLNIANNINDYFALMKISNTQYNLYYFPTTTNVSDIFRVLQDNNLEVDPNYTRDNMHYHTVSDLEIKNLFKDFLSSGYSSSSISGYTSVLARKSYIDVLPKHLSVNSIYELGLNVSIDELRSYNEIPQIKELNAKDNNIFSAALEKYISFLNSPEVLELNKGVLPFKLEQKIFYGAPGTGKSYKVDSITAKYKHSKVTFHPDTDYSSFVGCYKPSLDSVKDIITYSFVPQIFTKAYVAAWRNLEKPYYLVIEEINRGNCAQIFGDIFQLLDRNDAGFSKYAIDVDSDFADYLKSELSGVEGYLDKIKELAGPEHTVDYSTIVLPNNLSIIATMNTSDQSLFPMDSAFKRRWDWEYIPIDPMKDEVKDVKIDIEGTHYSWSKFLENVNKGIYEVNTSEDKQLGQFFATKGEDITFEQFRSKVMFYLWFEIYKDEDAKSIFKVYKEGSSTEMEPFTFGDLFKADGVDKLNKFMVDSMKLDALNKNPEEEIEQQAEAAE